MYDDVLCVIPARSGSKGIPKKNLVPLNGLPLFLYSVKQAIEAYIPRNNIVVSSDDEEILKLAKEWKVVAHRRPDEICGDNSSTELAMLDALQVQPDCECMVLLQPTSPIRFRGRIKQCIDIFKKGRHEHYDSLVATTKFYNFCWYQEQQDSNWSSTYDPKNRPMRSALPIKDLLQFDNGSLYITRREFLEKEECRLGGNVCVVPISHVEGMQIDDQKELEIAEKILSGNVCLIHV